MAKEVKITLAAARVNKGLTQLEAGKILGVSKETIKNIELGKTDPHYSTIVKMSDLYDIPINHLIIDIK